MADIIQNNRVNYYNKDFSKIREDLINYAKAYFPLSGNDFSPASPGVMFIELVSYIGDLLSFYIDKQIQETFINTATERENIIQIANMLGYNHKNVSPANVTLSFFQLVPADVTGSADLNYALKINAGSLVQSTDENRVTFRILEDVNFKLTGSSDAEIDIYQTSGTTPTYYLLKQKVRASAGELFTEDFYFSANTAPNPSIRINRTDIIEILDVIDNTGNEWYEVPHLAQQTIMKTNRNDALSTNDLYVYEAETPYLLEYLVTNKKFIKRTTSDNYTELIFGAGVSANADNEIFANQENVNEGFFTQNINNMSVDPTNFVYLKATGEVPRDKTLTVRYYAGGGYTGNVAQDTITEIETLNFAPMNESILDVNVLQFVKNSVTVTNEEPAQGGRGEETNDEIKQNALAFFNAQNRCVTANDYMIRTLSLPQKFGSVAKVFVKKEDEITVASAPPPSNPLSINLYCLAYDSNKNFTLLNDATKYNLVKYLNFYRMITDVINIKNTYIINIGVQFQIVVLNNYNQNEVLARCILKLKEYFDNDKMQINKPIIFSEIYNLISLVNGVQSVVSVDITNKFGGSYSNSKYKIGDATRNGILYPAKDASIFEVKFPDVDIEGRVVNY